MIISSEAYLPSDIITDLLTRLPVKSLLRFRLVSKSFRALIDSNEFVKLHINHSFVTKTNHYLVLNHSHLSYVDLYEPKQQPLQPHYPLKPTPFGLQILGSVNGLLSIFNGEDDVVIWNLATRRYQRVSVNKIEYPTASHDVFIRLVIYGFGYDSVSDDYKLIRMVQFYTITEQEFDEDSLDTETKLYSLRSKSWQKIQSFPYYLWHPRGHGVLACGALHWIVSRVNHPNIAVIAAFNLTTNEYSVIDVPGFLSQGLVQKNVWELGGSLCFTFSYVNDHVDLWVMRNYGEKDSWTKLFSISQPKDIRSFRSVTPLAYSKKGNEILLVEDNENLLGCDPEEESVRVIDVCGFPHYFESAICVGSLVHLSGKAEEYACKRRRQKRRGKKRFGEE